MRILLIDNGATSSCGIVVGLTQQGYAVDVAGSAAEGSELASVDHHDVIIIDVALPGGDGVELCREIRRHKVSAPILMLSTLDATNDKVVGLDAGADDYITKPLEFDELLARLRSLLRRSQSTEGAVLRSGGLVMDLLEHRVIMDGLVVKLTAKEFALLEYMMRNPRKLLTRSMISESVWDMNYESASNVIDVYVSSLRHKIDRDPLRRRIETVIGSGYRFVDPGADQGAATGTASVQ